MSLMDASRHNLGGISDSAQKKNNDMHHHHHPINIDITFTLNVTIATAHNLKIAINIALLLSPSQCRW